MTTITAHEKKTMHTQKELYNIIKNDNNARVMYKSNAHIVLNIHSYYFFSIISNRKCHELH